MVQPATQDQQESPDICLPLICKNVQQNPGYYSVSDRRRAAQFATWSQMDTLFSFSEAPGMCLPFVWANSTAWPDLPP